MPASWPDLTAVELLVAVADHGSLSAGARAVGMAQPNATRSVARLERRLGIPLLHRSTSGSTLTPAGLLVVEWSRDLLRAASAMLDGAAGLAVDGGAGLAVAASQTIAEQLLPRWLAAFRARHPDVTITVAVQNSESVLDQVRRGRCDLGFVEGPQAPRDLNHAVVAQDELVLVVAPGHPWARRRTPVSTVELVEVGLVTRESGSGTRTALEDAVGVVAPTLELASNAAVRVAVQAGSGPAVLSRHAVLDAVTNGTLVEVAAADLPIRRALRAVWTGPTRPPALVAELVATARSSSRASERPRPVRGGR